jgi:urocanate hydratase
VMVNDLDEALRILKNAVRKGDPASVGLIANASELLPELARRGVLPDLLTDQTPADDLLAYIPRGLTIAQAADLRQKDARDYRERAWDSIAAHVRGMLELKKMGSIVFEFGNGIGAQALSHGVAGAGGIPDFASQYLRPDLAQGRGLLTFVALSGDPDDLARIDSLVPMLFPDSELDQWITIARKRPSPGSPARSCWIGPREAIRLSVAINDVVARGEVKAPVAIGRALRQNRALNSPGTPSAAQGSNPLALADPPSDWPALPALLASGAGAAWLALQEITGQHGTSAQSSYVALVADGQPPTAQRIERLFCK